MTKKYLQIYIIYFTLLLPLVKYFLFTAILAQMFGHLNKM